MTLHPWLCTLSLLSALSGGSSMPVASGHPVAAGDELPKGPPWFQTYRGARRDALRHGRPVFVYFTKTV